jgi:hypothetical protein
VIVVVLKKLLISFDARHLKNIGAFSVMTHVTKKTGILKQSYKNDSEL